MAAVSAQQRSLPAFERKTPVVTVPPTAQTAMFTDVKQSVLPRPDSRYASQPASAAAAAPSVRTVARGRRSQQRSKDVGFNPLPYMPYALSAAKWAYKEYKSYMREKAPDFSIVGSKRAPSGGKVTRVYRADQYIANSTSTSTSALFSLNLVNTAGTIQLILYNGRAVTGTGTSLGAFPDFTNEVSAFNNTFKWLAVKRFQVECIPVVGVVTESATSISDQAVDCDPGVVFLREASGDEMYFTAATGVSTEDYTNYQRHPHLTWEPVGTKQETLSVFLTTPQETAPQYGSQELFYPRVRPMETNVVNVPGAAFPMYGISLFWKHTNLSGNPSKYRILLRFSVEVQWNTVKDDALTLASQQAAARDAYVRARTLSGQPMPVQPAGGQTVYYPEVPVDNALEPYYQQSLVQSQTPFANELVPLTPIVLPQEDYVEVPNLTKPVVKTRPPSPARR